MFRSALLVATLMLMSGVIATAHGEEGAATADREAITQTALNFEEGWYTADANRMALALHPQFLMRHVGTDEHTHVSVVTQNVNASELIALTRSGRGKVPAERQRHDVTVLDVFNNAATAKIVAWYGVDYLQLVKWNDRWVIMSVVWGKNPA